MSFADQLKQERERLGITNADADVRFDVQTICETVFETGMFW